MIEAFSPVRTSFYTLLALFIALFFGTNVATVIPAVLLLMALHGFETYYRADLDSIYGQRQYTAAEKLSLFRMSVFLATLAVASALYFDFSYLYVLLALAAAAGPALSHGYQFASDLLVAAIYPALLMVHSADAVALAPVYWFVFFQELAFRSAFQLTRPFGMENFNLPQILGTEAARLFVVALECMAGFWPILMARYTVGFAFVAFSLSAMVLAAAVYAMQVTHVDRARRLMEASAAAFLAGLYLSLL
jgi:hypothetical protein